MKNKIIKISLVIIGIILMIIGFYRIAEHEVKTVQGKVTNLKASTTSRLTMTSGEIDPNSYSYHIDTGAWEAITGNSWAYPVYQDYQIYCINPGPAVKIGGDITYAEAKALEGKTYYRNCGHHADMPQNGATTPARFVPVETHPLPIAAAYIVSDNDGSWEEKQKGIWNLRDLTFYNSKTGKNEPADDNIIIGDANSVHAGPTKYDEEAIKYAEYDTTVRDTGLQPLDQTDIDKVYTKANQKTKEYTVGPFNIEYKNATYGNITFGGISEMKVIGYNKKGEQVRDNIEIERILLKDKATGIYGEGVIPQYFEPSKDSKVDKSIQVYPASGQDFQIVFKDPNNGLKSNDSNRVATISIKVKFKHMLANGKYTKLKGTTYTVAYTCNDYNPHTHTCHHYNSEGEHYGCHKVNCTGCKTTCYLKQSPQQWLIVADGVRTIYEQEVEIGKAPLPDKPKPPRPTPPKPVKITMDLGGHVFEDVPAGKENTADGISGILLGNNSAKDRAIPNVKVTLYNQDGTIATLLSNPNEEGITNEQIMHRINPTYTDSEGNYLFEGLDSMKKYYVTFEYNGQIYLPTDYLNAGDKQYLSVSQIVNAGLYNKETWKVTSKATEISSDRNSHNETFKEIGSSPLNYVSSNSLGKLTKTSGKYYNETYSQNDLMGFELDKDGNYQNTGIALVDGFYEIRDGNIVEIDTIREGIISKKIREYVNNNKKSPDENAIKQIYKEIAGDSQELWQKLQFIEDCKINASTRAQGSKTPDLFPVYDKFRINKIDNNSHKTAKDAQNANYDTRVEVINGVTYNPIYPGQYFVNLGLWRRQEVDLALRKDIAYAATRINGKTEIYKYDKRAQITDAEREELARLRAIYEADRSNLTNYNAYLEYKEKIEQEKGFWEIQLRMRDYEGYYGANYTRELYKADFEYNATNAHTGSELELYVTYKITIRNGSESILSEVKEIVDYYDEDYEYRNDLSWIMYKNNSDSGIDELIVTDDDYYKTMDTLKPQGNIYENNKVKNTNNVSSTSKYGKESHSDMQEHYNTIYIKGLENKKLASGEEAYVYLTFEVKKNENGKILLDDDNVLKQNYVEINGYTTYYKDGTKLPNGQNKNSTDAAGIIDINSNPGNLKYNDTLGERAERNFENDTDRAKSIKVTVDKDFVRSINGIAWEDQRTKAVSSAVIGDGVRQDGEIGIKGVKVELIEKLENGKEYVWYTTTTDADGKYEFKTDETKNAYIIPGDYIVRFYYGNSKETVVPNTDGNKTSYNGQDFKTTVYQKDMNGKEIANSDKTYNIQAADAFGSNLSDAKDIWEKTTRNVIRIKDGKEIESKEEYIGRTEVNNYSISNVTNHKAEVLAAPYENPSNEELIKELIQNTNMTAETGIIVLQGEYDRTKTDGEKESNGTNIYHNGNDINGKYSLNNVDLGLSERPKAQLELGKKVTNVKVTLANGNTIFDATKGGRDLTWNPKNSPYELNKTMKNGKYEDYYKTSNRYAYRTEVNKLVNGKYDSSGNNGLIAITMDEELMHGATIRISYELTVANVGETDYAGKDFYYKGTGAIEANKVNTSADVVLDYVANNLQYRENDNNGWKKIENVVASEELNKELEESVKAYNTVIKTEGLNKKLTPGQKVAAGLVLTQMITSENTADDRTYDNIAEITKISNSVGRRMAYSVQGNQKPTEQPKEVDSVKSERIVILPPFGIGEIVVYVAIATAALATLTLGIIFIKKRFLK